MEMKVSYKNSLWEDLGYFCSRTGIIEGEIIKKSLKSTQQETYKGKISIRDEARNSADFNPGRFNTS